MIIIFMVVLLKFFIQFKLILIKSNVFCNYIFIYYKNNHKCNIGTIINHKFNNFCHTKIKKKKKILKNSKGKLTKIFIF